MPPHDQFRYDGVDIDPVVGRRHLPLLDVDATPSSSATRSGPGGDWDDPAVQAAVRILFLLAGVSYYKTAAPRRSSTSASSRAPPSERAFLTRYYVEGLGEFAYRNGLDLRDLQVVGPDADARARRRRATTRCRGGR